MTRYLVLVVICIHFVCNSEAISGRLLFRGRPVDKHGMVRPPVAPIGHFTQSLAQTYKQKVNHLDPKDNRTFDQLYFTSGTHHKPGGPLFLFFGGEGAASAGWLESSFMADMGRKYGAYLVELEHRYYGVSQPFDELTVENMKYLSSEQALQDTDDFLHFLLKNLKLEGSKVVVFGGSYAGALAAWFREKYPKTAAGAIASSGPVEAVVDFKEYLGVVTNSLGKECSDNIREASKEIEEDLKTQSGRAELKKLFNLCESLDGVDTYDVYNFASSLTDTVAGIVQYNSNIQGFCRTVIDKTGGARAIDRYARAQASHHGGQCIDFSYKNMIKSVSQTSKHSSAVTSGMRQWTYQTCTEFGYYQTTSLKDSPFGHNLPVEFFTKQCTDIFGVSAQAVQKAIDQTNSYYGGFKPNVTNVVFPNGSLDPWHALSVLKDLNNSTKAVMIEGKAHCGDMYASSPSETESLKSAHKLIEQQIGEYLK